ncbi:MAG TPA: RidA family protein [Pseudolabrys sp.]|nr:RidA family protein [Pseudolabrys sp.]
MTIDLRLQELGLVLPQPPRIPPGVVLPFGWVRVCGRRALISGHGPTNPDGSFAAPLGRVGSDVTREQAYHAARLTGLAMLASLKRELGNLDRIACWVRAFGMVNCAPGFREMPGVINGFSDLVIEVFGQERGQHARSAVGVAELPFDIPVEIEGEVLID